MGAAEENGLAQRAHPLQACEVPAVVAALSDESDEEALEWLREAGYRRPQDIAHIVSGWGAARYRAMRSEAAREQLARMLPNILSAFAQGRDPDAAIAIFDRFLAGPEAPNGNDVDLLIRTGGEKRLSDFLLWESAYAELCFVDTLWPDFDAAGLSAAVAEFWRRDRRFGGLTQPAPLIAAE